MNRNEWTVKYQIKPAMIDAYENLFHDHHPLHKDGDTAKQLGFSDRLVHGNILGGFISHFVGMIIARKTNFLIRQQMDFVKPVYENDALELQVTIRREYASVSITEYAFKFINQNRIVVARGTFQCMSKQDTIG